MRELGLVLPTEAQWEYACRAGTTTIFWTGDAQETLAGAATLLDASLASEYELQGKPFEKWLNDGFRKTAPIGSFRPNPLGLCDITGNVYEWVRDIWALYESPARRGDGLRLEGNLDLRIY